MGIMFSFEKLKTKKRNQEIFKFFFLSTEQIIWKKVLTAGCIAMGPRDGKPTPLGCAKV